MAMMTTLDPPLAQEFIAFYAATVWDATSLMLALFAPLVMGALLFGLALLLGAR